MKMISLEKKFVNREKKGLANAERVRRRLQELDTSRIHDVLEIGCGMGTVSEFLAREYPFDVTAVDSDPAQVRLAHDIYGSADRLRYQMADATALPFPENRFDLVVSQNVFHHIPRWHSVVSEISRVLRPGGQLIWLDIVVPPGMKLLLRPLALVAGVYTSREVRDAFAGVGLEPIASDQHSHGLIAHMNSVLQKH